MKPLVALASYCLATNESRYRMSSRLAIFIGLVILAIAMLVAPHAWVHQHHQASIYYSVAEIPQAPIAIVFGAGLTADGEPSWMLADRVDAAVDLYLAGKVQRLLMSGDNSRPEYDEVTAMKRRAVERGVPNDKINLDYAGFRTYDTCFRARYVFNIERAILVTQAYHLPRALYLAEAFGIRATGLKSGQDRYAGQRFYDLRESLANIVAWYEVHITRPLPHYLGEPVNLETQFL
jgi:vancomycin permeability regulator SanA